MAGASLTGAPLRVGARSSDHFFSLAESSTSMAEPLEDLRAALTGDLLVEGDPGYERARLCFNLLIDRRPAAIARCSMGTTLQRPSPRPGRGLEIAVRGGGHNPAGPLRGRRRPCDRPLAHARRPCRPGPPGSQPAKGGATWLDFDSRDAGARPRHPRRRGRLHRGDGPTLGGGIGHLTAQFGLTCDSLRRRRGGHPGRGGRPRERRKNPELLWGLRGGGGNFGVATEIELRLHPLERVLGGRLDVRGRGRRRGAPPFP